MRVLLDTHALIWITMVPERVSKALRGIIEQDTTAVFVSAVSAWEIATKVRIGKIAFDAGFLDDFDARTRSLAFEPLAVTAHHAVIGARLAGTHKDPFDRLLVGQAIAEDLTIATIDHQLAALGAAVIW
jgi:PIN domain nuclease of toxin-antitoxin system